MDRGWAVKLIIMKKATFPPMPPDPYHRDDKKGASCRIAVARGELSLNPNAVNYIGNYIFYDVDKNGDPGYISKVEARSHAAEAAEERAYIEQMQSTGRIY